ncbi:hypothetical protein HOY34_13040 [Xinfangfangia sp. D13-10-4-6]|uniref:hypothetical protein n=1 Tax=Pseudogemmobacter hezensis TaxID=2737662 RepID=UPI001552A7DF|nr:hypothetical protein [Pseudogemmobacter hezensis]NPD16124.1 hypothetical protein [Pseudogemmobacter hezensis]
MTTGNQDFTGLSSHAQMLDSTFPNGVIGLNRVEKVFIAANALQTTNAEAICDLIGIPQKEAIWLLGCLEDADWNVADAIERDANCQSINHALNQETYSILRMNGVAK